jgi:uncharacterized membrane protein
MDGMPDLRDQTRKTWAQVSEDLRCPIVGVCLTMAEQRGILKKANVPLKGLEDKDVHGLLVHNAGSDGTLARRVQHCLERKYRQEIKEWGVCQEQALLSRWEVALQCGKIGAAMWIAATHPCLSSEAVYRVFSDVHMLLYRQGKLVTQELRQGQRLRAQNEGLRDKLRKAQASRRETAEALQASRMVCAELELELAQARKLPKQDKSVTSCRARLQKAERQIQTQGAAIEGLKEEKKRLATELASASELNQMMRAELQDMLRALQQEEDACQTCPNRDLCDKRILLVGGITRLRTIYQILVEDLGGEFRHHDGRNSGGARALAGLIRWADVVLCPVDVNSHSACLGVKNTCKKVGKPYHMLPSSGVSSIARVLTEYCS